MSTIQIPPHFNFAKRSGIRSVPAASVFAVIYLPLLCWFIVLTAKNPTYVYAVLAFFCFLRIPSFTIRAILAGQASAAETLQLVIADQVLFGVGFFGLLYSAYILVLDRELVTDHAPPKGHMLQITRNRPAFRVALTAAVALGIASACLTTATRTSMTDPTIKSLRQASTSIFFILTVLQAFQTIKLSRMEYRDRRDGIDHGEANSFGARHSISILLAMSVLLLIRETFAMATVNNSVKQNNERLWYPLMALPELLAVLLYAIPGLIPPRVKPSDESDTAGLQHKK